MELTLSLLYTNESFELHAEPTNTMYSSSFSPLIFNTTDDSLTQQLTQRLLRLESTPCSKIVEFMNTSMNRYLEMSSSLRVIEDNQYASEVANTTLTINATSVEEIPDCLTVCFSKEQLSWDSQSSQLSSPPSSTPDNDNIYITEFHIDPVVIVFFCLTCLTFTLFCCVLKKVIMQILDYIPARSTEELAPPDLEAEPNGTLDPV